MRTKPRMVRLCLETDAEIEVFRAQLQAERPGEQVTTSDAIRVLLRRGLDASGVAIERPKGE